MTKTDDLTVPFVFTIKKLKKKKKRRCKVTELDCLKWISWHRPFNLWDLWFQYLVPQLHLCLQHRHPGTLLCSPMWVQALVCRTRQSLPVVKAERQEWAWMSLSWSQYQCALRPCQHSTHSLCFHDSVLHPLLLGRLPEQHGEGPFKPNTDEMEDKEVL